MRMRWVGHCLHLEAQLVVDGSLAIQEEEIVIDAVGHDLSHAVPNLAEVTLATVPLQPDGARLELQMAHHPSGS
jgi:divalent metal cation (Fe/Co/Zn/Cd) transporter